MILLMLMLLISYLMGSCSFAVLFSKLFHLPDPRTTGSHNPGATNMLRVAGKKYAAMVLVADALKGFLPVFVFKQLGFEPMVLGLIAFAAVLGHIYPVFLQFKGGKGVATALGTFFAIHLGLAGCVVATWLMVAFLTRYSSLAALIAISLSPFYAWLLTNSLGLSFMLSGMAGLIVYKHRSNIKRLWQGIEPQMGRSKGQRG